MKKAIYIIIATIVAIIIVIDIFLFVLGSLESCPTVEQVEKGRIIYGLFFIPLTIIEAFILTRFFNKK